jgi:DNA-binding response OmpR family regulator
VTILLAHTGGLIDVFCAAQAAWSALELARTGPLTALLVHNGSLADIVLALQLGWASIEIVHARTASETFRALDRSRPEIVVIDTREGSFDLAREVRRRSNAVVVAVSPHYHESELIAAVEAGCDDYMQAPVSAPTFVARVRAALRRANGFGNGTPGVAACGTLEVDPGRYEARLCGRVLRLTAKEFELLLYLVQQSGQVARHESLSRLIWGDASDLYGPWLRKYVQHLRQKLAEIPHSDVTIVTVPRVGYKLVNGQASGHSQLAARPA